MAEITQNATIILRNDTYDKIESSSVVLKQGEIALEYSSSGDSAMFSNIYFGDGKNVIKDCTNFTSIFGLIQEQLDDMLGAKDIVYNADLNQNTDMGIYFGTISDESKNYPTVLKLNDNFSLVVFKTQQKTNPDGKANSITQLLTSKNGCYIRIALPQPPEMTETVFGEWINLNKTLSDLGITATSTELNYTKGVTSSIQTQLNSKAGTALASESSNGLMSSSDKIKSNNSVIVYNDNASSTDWNTIVAQGYYSVAQSTFDEAKHQPKGAYGYGTLMVIKGRTNKDLEQIYLAQQGAEVWIRSAYNGTGSGFTWSTWYKLFKDGKATAAVTADTATNANSATQAVNATNAVNATTANKVANSLEIKVNNGRVASFDGSEAKSVNIPVFEGATSEQDGILGLVPAPSIAQKDMYLKADGTWASAEATLPEVIDCGTF